jgi:microcystin-dependent protein
MTKHILLGNKSAANGAYVGEVRIFANNTLPNGWLLCNGAAVSRTTYAALFSAIGTTWGVGDGSTTFNLPPADRAVVGAGMAYSLGETFGEDSHALTSSEGPTHTHTVTDPGHNHSVRLLDAISLYDGTTIDAGDVTDNYSSNSTVIATSTTGITINNAGSGTAHENRQKSAAFKLAIFTGT